MIRSNVLGTYESLTTYPWHKCRGWLGPLGSTWLTELCPRCPCHWQSCLSVDRPVSVYSSPSCWRHWHWSQTLRHSLLSSWFFYNCHQHWDSWMFQSRPLFTLVITDLIKVLVRWSVIVSTAARRSSIVVFNLYPKCDENVWRAFILVHCIVCQTRACREISRTMKKLC